MYTKACEYCSLPFTSAQPNKKTCSEKCKMSRTNEYYGRGAEPINIPSQKKGVMHEQIVSIEIARMDYDVYVSPYPQQKYDLVVMNRQNGKLLKVEVKTGYRSQLTRKVVFPKHSHEDWDYMAIYVANEDSVVFLDKNKNTVKELV